MATKSPLNPEDVPHFHRRRARHHGWYALVLVIVGMLFLLFWLGARLFGYCASDDSSVFACKSYIGGLFAVVLILLPLAFLVLELWKLGVFVAKPPMSIEPGHVYSLFTQSVQEAGGGALPFARGLAVSFGRGAWSFPVWERVFIIACLVFTIAFFIFGIWLIFFSPILL